MSKKKCYFKYYLTIYRNNFILLSALIHPHYETLILFVISNDHRFFILPP